MASSLGGDWYNENEFDVICKDWIVHCEICKDEVSVQIPEISSEMTKDGEIISGASSYSYCEGHIDITIETKPEYQQKRFGTRLCF